MCVVETPRTSENWSLAGLLPGLDGGGEFGTMGKSKAPKRPCNDADLSKTFVWGLGPKCHFRL
jgi:hypothetical protein